MVIEHGTMLHNLVLTAMRHRPALTVPALPSISRINQLLPALIL